MKDSNGFIQTPFVGKKRIHSNESILRNRFRTIQGRCTRPSNNRYYVYGARGIRCEWKSFDDFSRDMLESFKEHVAEHGLNETQIDRIDPDKNYCKENCRWVTRIENARNRRNIKPITYKGETKILSDWTKDLGLEFSRTYQRIYMYGWSVDDAFSPKKHVNQFDV